LRLLDNEDRVARTVMFVLGVLWIIDGVLQLQPASFTAMFADAILAPNLQGQPAVITPIIDYGVQFFNTNPLVVNLAATVVQLFIGFALVLPLAIVLTLFLIPLLMKPKPTGAADSPFISKAGSKSAGNRR